MIHISRIHLIIALCVSLAGCGRAGYAAWPTIQTYPQVSESTLVANDITEYTVTTTIGDNDGHNDIAEARVLFGFTEAGGDSSRGRGYMAWGISDNLITRYGGTWVLADAAGGGRWGYMTSSWGGTIYITPSSCTMSTGGAATGGPGTRTVTWTFKVKSAWANSPLINDADVWAADAGGNVIGWRDNPVEFDVVSTPCTSYLVTPQPPLVGNPMSNSLDVAIAPGNSALDTFCIRLSPSVGGKNYVQSDGTLGYWPVFRSKASWGTTRVTGLASDTAYSFSARAHRASLGICPSAWSDPAEATTAIAMRPIDYAAGGIAIHKGVHGMDALPKAVIAQAETDNLAVCMNTSMRWGGDGYNWKTRTAQWNSSTISTLQRLRQARDRNSYLQILTNTRGIGTGNGSTWVYTDQTPETLAALTADWVFYCNNLLQNKRQGEPLDAREQALLDSLAWGTDDKLLAPGEAPVPKVVYWELGNEPEGPYPPPSLTPEDYAARYKVISQAVLAEDPTIQIGPGCVTADNGNAWLDAVFSDPDNRVDFVAYHPYGPLYWITKTTSGGVLNADDLNNGLNTMKQQQVSKKQKMVDRLVANGRPASTPLIASEINPSSWEGTYYFNLNRTMAHALGVAEIIFAYVELGILATQYWDYPNWPSTAIEAPGAKVYKALQQDIGDRLLDSYQEHDFRLYTTQDSRSGRLVVWALNFSEYLDKRVRLQLAASASGLSITQKRLGAVSGGTSLVLLNGRNDSYEKVNWTLTDLTSTLDPADFSLTLPRATLTMIIFDRPLMTLPDGAAVTLGGKAVTAVHAADGYLYVEQDDRTWGVRVAGDCSGISVGDRVDVSGTMGTLRPDGSTPSERVITANSIARVSSGSQIEPLAINCRSVGGGPTDLSAGVKDMVGLSNIGLLVKTAGRVTSIVDVEHLCLDDGSNVVDVGGSIGVLVQCPDTSSLEVGDIVTVTGVVEGSVPPGWTANRRFIRARTAGDVAVVVE